MTTADPELLALCDAARQFADDDTPRLVLADWLDEHGGRRVKCPECKGKGQVFLRAAGLPGRRFNCDDCDGTGEALDTSNRERAELIRMQVELAKFGPKPRELYVTDGEGKMLEGLGVAMIPRGDGHYTASYAESGLSIDTFTPGERVDVYAHLARGDRHKWLHGLKYVRRVEDRQEHVFRKDDQSGPWAGTDLAARESAILAAHPDWLPVCPACCVRGGLLYDGLGAAKCPACHGSGRVGTFSGGLLQVPVPAMDAVWRFGRVGRTVGRHPTPWALAIRDEFPWVVEMPILDRQSGLTSDGRSIWWGQDDTANPADLPFFVWDRIAAESRYTGGASATAGQEAKAFPTPAAANRALARAVALALFTPTAG